jgi:ribosomal protein L37E
VAEEKGLVGRFLSRLTKPFSRRTTPEPMMPLWKTGIQEPVLVQGVSIPALYATVQESIILRTTINTLCQEIFRRGYYWEKKFHKKCTNCGEEYQHDTVDECRICGNEEFDSPDADQIIYPRWLMKERNSMDQSFIEVMKEIEWDLDIVDDAFLLLIKEYFIDPKSGEIEFFRVKELVRGDPTFMRIVADKAGKRGGRYLLCPIHRDKTYPHNGDHHKCDVDGCGLPLQDVHYINTAGSGKTQYYIEGEVLHTSKFNPSKLYGRSPVASMWRQAQSLTAMDNYIYLAYQKRRIPRGILAITTDNIQSTAAFWKGAEEKMERDPHYIPKVGVESASGRGKVEFVRFMDSLDEMQYAQVRDEIRMRIAAFYGVSNVFMMDAGKSGGLNNEGMQILVTNRAVESGQKLYSRELFPRMLDQMGVEDWVLTLYPNEEEDEITRLRRDEQEVNIAQRMQQLGFLPEMTENGGSDIRFTYSKPDPQPQDPNAAGGGMPPGGMPPGGMPPGGGMPPPMPPGGGGIPPQGGGAMMPPGAGASPPVGGASPQGGAPIMMMEKGGAIGLGESQGLRDRGPAPISSETQQSGAPSSKKNQRGSEKTPLEQALDSVQAAKDPTSKNKESGF